MKKVLFCLLIGFITASCQNGAVVKEGQIRDNFGGYCKLTGGTYEPEIDPNVCICGNYRCYNRACNYEGNGCDERVCYAGDQRCNKTDIKVCTSVQIEETPYYTPHDFTDDDSCNTVSCTQANDPWHYKCGECLNNEFKCIQDNEDNTAGHLIACHDGHWVSIKKCEGGCEYEDGKTESIKCQSCTGEYCINTDDETGNHYECEGVRTFSCENIQGVGEYYSCHYVDNKSDCGICLNETTNCEHVQLPDSSELYDFEDLYISKEECKNGIWVPFGETNPTEILLYYDQNCSSPILKNVCLKIGNENKHYPVYYFFDSQKGVWTAKVCQYDCDPNEGCLDRGVQGICTGDKNCIISYLEEPTIPPEKETCTYNEDVSVCPHGRCNQNNQCVDSCIVNASCDTGCSFDYCDAILYYCNTTNTSYYPYFFANELHINADQINLLSSFNISDCPIKIDTLVLHGDPDGKFEINCDEFTSISLPDYITKVKGALNEKNEFPIIQCKSDGLTRPPLSNPLFKELNNITLEDFGVDIDFTPGAEDEKGGLANEINNSTLKNISMAGSITCSISDCGLLTSRITDSTLTDVSISGLCKCNGDNCGLLAGTVSNSKLTELSITGSSECNGNNCGLLSGTVTDSKLTEVSIAGSSKCKGDYCGTLAGTAKYQNVQETMIDIIGMPDVDNPTITVSSNGNNIGGLIGNLIITGTINIPEQKPPFKLAGIHIENVDGQTNVGGLIGLLSMTSISNISSPEIEELESNFDNNTINTVAGKNNIGGLVGSISCSDKADCSYSIKASRNTITNQIFGEDNVGGLTGYIGCTDSNICDKTIPNIIYAIFNNKIENNKSDDKPTVEGANNVGGFIGSIGCTNNNTCNFSNSKFELTGIGNILNDTVNGINNVGGVIGAASSLSQIEQFKLNDFEPNPYTGQIIGGKSASNAYESRNIGGLIGKQVIDNTKGNYVSIKNIKLKLDSVACAEYYDRFKACSDNNCTKDELCQKAIQCTYGGGAIGFFDMLNKPTTQSHNQLLYIKNLSLHLNTLAISQYSAGIVVFPNTSDDNIKYNAGIVKIEDVLITIKNVDGRLDIFGKFRGVANHLILLTELFINNIVAVIKLTDDPKINYCLYKGEYDGTATSPEKKISSCLLSSATTDGKTTSKLRSNMYCNKTNTCFTCVNDYLTQYPNFLVYGPECKDNKLKRICKPDSINAVYFYQFANYSTHHHTYAEVFDATFGHCIANEQADICTFLQRDCRGNADGTITGIGASSNLYCCGNTEGGKCNNNGDDVCKDAPNTTRKKCADIKELDKFKWPSKTSISIKGKDITLPSPI